MKTKLIILGLLISCAGFGQVFSLDQPDSVKYITYPQVYDLDKLYFQASVSAGPDDTITAGETYQLAGSQQYMDSVVWTTSGTGTFNDDNALDAVYTPSAVDQSTGSVNLTLTGVVGRQSTMDVMTLTMYDGDAMALFARMETLPTSDEMRNISNLIDSLQATGIWDSLLYFQPIGHDIQSSLLDWKGGLVSTPIDTPYIVPYVGVRRNEIDGVLNTHFNPRNTEGFETNRSMLGVYIMDYHYNTGLSAQFGGSDGTNYISWQIGRDYQKFKYLYFNSLITSGYSTEITTETKGFFHLRRTANNVVDLFLNDTKKGSLANASSNTPNIELYIGANNNSDSYSASGNIGLISLVYTAKNLSDEQVLSFNRIMKDYFNGFHKQYWYTENELVDYAFNYVSGVSGVATNVYKRDSVSIVYHYDSLMYVINNRVVGQTKITGNNIQSAYVFKNGTVIFAQYPNNLYKSIDSLKTITQIYAKSKDGGNYTIHTPVNASYPGRYFRTEYINQGPVIGGKEYAVWGNYANVVGGAAPLNIYYSIDGDSVVVGYSFGQNLNTTDNGTTTGGVGGNVLGDANSDLVIRHVHDVIYNPNDTTWICITGDNANESKWIKFYFEDDTLSPMVLATYNEGGRFKSEGLNISGDSITWVSDDTTLEDLGIFRAKITEIADTSKHRKLLSLSNVGYYLKKSGNNYLLLAPDKKLYISIDDGNNFSLIPQFINIATNMGSLEYNTFSGLMPLDGGNFHLYLKSTERSITMKRGTSLIIKPKQ